jgi:hypothetical protein
VPIFCIYINSTWSQISLWLHNRSDSVWHTTNQAQCVLCYNNLVGLFHPLSELAYGSRHSLVLWQQDVLRVSPTVLNWIQVSTNRKPRVWCTNIAIKEGLSRVVRGVLCVSIPLEDVLLPTLVIALHARKKSVSQKGYVQIHTHNASWNTRVFNPCRLNWPTPPDPHFPTLKRCKGTMLKTFVIAEFRTGLRNTTMTEAINKTWIDKYG